MKHVMEKYSICTYLKQGSSLNHAPTKWLETTLSGVYCQMVTIKSLLPDCNCLMSTVSWLLLDG